MKMKLICAPKGQQTIAGGERSEPPVANSEGKALKGRQKSLSPFQGFADANASRGEAS